MGSLVGIRSFLLPIVLAGAGCASHNKDVDVDVFKRRQGQSEATAHTPTAASASALDAPSHVRTDADAASIDAPVVLIDDLPVYETWIDQRSAHSHDQRVSVDRLPIPGGVRLNIATGGMPITNMTIDLRRRDDGQVAVVATGKWCEDTRGHPRAIDVPLDCRLIMLNTSYVGTANPLNIKFAARYSADGHVGVISGAISQSN